MSDTAAVILNEDPVTVYTEDPAEEEETHDSTSDDKLAPISRPSLDEVERIIAEAEEQAFREARS